MPEVTFRDRTMGTYRRAAPLFVRGEGAWMVDDEGGRFLDLISGIGANSLGHGHPRLAAAHRHRRAVEPRCISSVGGNGRA